MVFICMFKEAQEQYIIIIIFTDLIKRQTNILFYNNIEYSWKKKVKKSLFCVFIRPYPIGQ